MKFNPENGNLIVSIPQVVLKDLNLCLKNNPPKFGVKYHKSLFVFILGKIFSLSNSKRFRGLDKVPLSSIVLLTEIGKHYKKYLNYLLENDFLDTDNHYIVGSDFSIGKCKCYGFTEKYKKHGKIDFFEISHKSVLRNYLLFQKKNFKRISDDKFLSHLYDMLSKVSIDISSAKKFLNKIRKEKGKDKIWVDREIKKCKAINKKNAIDKYLYLVKDNYGRVHTNLTNLSKYIRENFLKLDGKPVGSIDLVSSQPSLLYLLLKNYIEKLEKCDEKSGFCKNFNYIPLVDLREKYINFKNWAKGKPVYPVFDIDTDFLPLNDYHKNEKFITNAKKELEIFKFALKNDIYTYFNDLWKKYFSETLSRNDMKLKWIKFLFGHNKFCDKKMKEIWINEFPNLYKIIYNIKSTDYRFLAHKLQKTESDLIFNKICKLIDMELGINYVTVHDCIIVQKEHIDNVVKIFQKVLNEVGLVSGFSITNAA